MRKVNTTIDLPSNADIERYRMLSPMLDSALSEMREFAKKKQYGILNPLKVKLINRLLTDIQTLLISQSVKQYLDMLDEDTLPQNSDAVLILGQYSAAMDEFKRKYFRYDPGMHENRWRTKEEP